MSHLTSSGLQGFSTFLPQKHRCLASQPPSFFHQNARFKHQRVKPKKDKQVGNSGQPCLQPFFARRARIATSVALERWDILHCASLRTTRCSTWQLKVLPKSSRNNSSWRLENTQKTPKGMNSNRQMVKLREKHEFDQANLGFKQEEWGRYAQKVGMLPTVLRICV